MDRFIIGVDGGGTKTDCALFRLDGSLVEFLRWGTTSHEFLEGGYAAAEREIGQMLQTLFRHTDVRPEQIMKGVFGLAGVDTGYQEKKMGEMLEKNGMKEFVVCNDGYLGIKAGTTRGVGINVINGTGCSFEGINAKGEMLQIGGQSVIMDDVAGGYIIGRNIVRLVQRELFLKGRKTILTQMLMAETGTDDKMELMDELIRRADEGTLEIKHLSHFMFEAAAQKDLVAISYCEQMGRDIAEYCKAIIRNLRLYEEKTIEIVLIGSAFLKAASDIHTAVMREEITREYPGAVFKPLAIKPVCGAVLWAFSACGPVSDAMKEKILQQLA